MASDVRPRQNDTQSAPCVGPPRPPPPPPPPPSPPVSDCAIAPSARRTNGTATSTIQIKEGYADASKMTSPSLSHSGSASVSPTADSPALSHSSSTPSLPIESSLPSSHSASHYSAHTTISPAAASSSSTPFVKETNTLDAAAPTAADSSLPTTTTAASTTAAVSSKPSSSASIRGPDSAAAELPSSSPPLDLAAAPSTTTAAPAPSSASSASEPATTAEKDQDMSPPPAAGVPLSSTSLPAQILSTADGLAVMPDTLPTDTNTPSIPSSTANPATSTSSLRVTHSSDAAAPTTNKGVVGIPGGGVAAAPTPSNDLQLQNDGDGGGPSMGVIIGGAVGGAAALAILALLVWLWRRRARNRKDLGRPHTPLAATAAAAAASSHHQPPCAITGPFVAGRQASMRIRNPLQGWWASHGPPPRINGDQPMRQVAPAATDDPFSDAHSTQAQQAVSQQQRLRGILKQPAPSLHSSHPSDASYSSVAAERRSRAHSLNGQRAAVAATRRTSSLTNDPFQDRRNKFRSDPFDLELDRQMLGQSSGHIRASSVYSGGWGGGAPSSRYTSGVSSAWGAEPMAVGNRPGASDSPTLPQQNARGFEGGGFVGQAM
ncbi:hypothetical protein CRV24_002706 [Beauveria bassiana]|nr:hypothetical protein CRV24_002706 [Beauveria bassiana]KAH8718095.1 hypothetical protein HC256_002749 [Beauveria bassiana]